MNSPERDGEAGPAAPGADLSLLVETEQRLEELLDRAREEARMLVASARAEIQAASAAQDLELARAREGFQAEVEAERTSRAAKILVQGKAGAAKLDAVEGEAVARLGGFALAQLLSGMNE